MRERWVILAELCNKINARTVVEVGVSRGINASAWLSLCPFIQQMHLVDQSNSVFDIGLFDGVQSKLGMLCMSSLDAAKILPNSLDLVYIDADHGYQAVKDDIDAWLPKIRKGGILCGHDYIKEYNPHSEVRFAVDSKFTKMNLEQDTLENGQIYVWWVQK